MLVSSYGLILVGVLILIGILMLIFRNKRTVLLILFIVGVIALGVGFAAPYATMNLVAGWSLLIITGLVMAYLVIRLLGALVRGLRSPWSTRATKALILMLIIIVVVLLLVDINALRRDVSRFNAQTIAPVTMPLWQRTINSIEDWFAERNTLYAQQQGYVEVDTQVRAGEANPFEANPVGCEAPLTVVVRTNNPQQPANVRPEPNTTEPRIDQYASGTQVIVTGFVADFAQISLVRDAGSRPANSIAYMAKSVLALPQACYN